jgi:hypothetical protein
MRREIFDAYGTVVKVLHTHDHDAPGKVVVQTLEDVEPILEEAKALRENHKGTDTMKHVARVPSSVVEQAMREGWFHDQKKWDQWLNDPQNKGFRVWEGTV